MISAAEARKKTDEVQDYMALHNQILRDIEEKIKEAINVGDEWIEVHLAHHISSEPVNKVIGVLKENGYTVERKMSEYVDPSRHIYVSPKLYISW